MKAAFRNRKADHRQPRPAFALCVVLTGDRAGMIENRQINHPSVQADINRGDLRLFDPAKDSRGPAKVYVNLWQNPNRTPSEWYPETEGYWAVAFADGFDGKFSDGRRMMLNLGSIGSPHRTLRAGLADLALAKAIIPDAADKLALFHVPCAFSSREGWVSVNEMPTAEMVADAAQSAKSHFGLESFERKYGLSKIYM